MVGVVLYSGFVDGAPCSGRTVSDLESLLLEVSSGRLGWGTFLIAWSLFSDCLVWFIKADFYLTFFSPSSAP